MEGKYVIKYDGVRLAKKFPDGAVFRRDGDNCYYFDRDHICRMREATEMEKKYINWYTKDVCSFFWLGKVEGSLEWKNYDPLDQVIAQKIEVGQKLEDVIYKLTNECSVPQELEDGIPIEASKAFIRYFSFRRPQFHEQLKDSKYYKTISLEIGLTSDVTKEIVDKYRLALDKTVIEKIEGSRQFRKLDKPLSKYKLERAELSTDAALFYYFSINPKFMEDILKTASK